MRKIPIIDLHTDFVLSCYKMGEKFKSKKQINLKLVRKANVKIFFSGFSYDNVFNDTERQINILLKVIKNKKNNLQLIKTRKDIRDITNSKTKIGVILHLEGSKIVDERLKLFNKLYEKGLRSLSLTHSEKNQFAAGNKVENDVGLTELGRKLIKEAVKKNIIIDLSHLNYKSFYQVLNLTSNYQPPIVTHSATYKYCPDPRNLKDDQIKTIAKQEGLIGVFFSARYVRNDGKKATIDDVIKHFTHIASVGGSKILAIGSDFGGITTGLPQGLENITKLLILVSKLKKAGFTDEEIENIYYKNAQSLLLKIIR